MSRAPNYRRTRAARLPEPSTTPPGVTKERIDRVLASLHVRKEANTAELAALLATHSVVIQPLLQHMLAMQLLVETVSSPISLWKLTFSGAKEAVFAFHRVRAASPRTMFVDGINPWTGVKVRNSIKNR